MCDNIKFFSLHNFVRGLRLVNLNGGGGGLILGGLIYKQYKHMFQNELILVSGMLEKRI